MSQDNRFTKQVYDNTFALILIVLYVTSFALCVILTMHDLCLGATEKGAGVSASSPISRAVLQEFYHPFNELLDILVEVSGIASGPIHYNEPDA